jgi:predicted  nucleic acid-binding Zn-ribbon protein
MLYDQLQSIVELQKIDSEIDKLENQKALEPAKIHALESELSKYKLKFDSKTKAIEDLQKQKRDLDKKLLIQQEKIRKYTTHRPSIKTNKEYTALELEISELEILNSEIEEEIIKLMLEIDNVNEELESAKKELKVQEGIFQKKKEEVLTEIKGLNKQIAEWSKNRNGFTSDINPTLLNKYNDWRKKRGGSLVAVIKGQTCEGCHLMLPLQLINEVRKKKDFHICNSCGRILYWIDEVEIIENNDKKKRK